MSKSKKQSRVNTNNQFADDEERLTRKDFERDRERKNQKRLDRALKTKNISELIEDDDYDNDDEWEEYK